MTHHASRHPVASSIDAGQQVAQLRQVLGLVERIAGRGDPSATQDSALEENARISIAYNSAPSIVRRRFDSMAGETAAWAAAGVEALVASRGSTATPRAAAGRLADELGQALNRMAQILSA